MYSRLQGQVPIEIEELLYSLKEVGRLACMSATDRTPKSILRLYNVSFVHALRCVQVFGDKPKLTKIYGTYYHSIVTHMAEHYHIIALSSLYTKSEERIFNVLRGIARDTTCLLYTSPSPRDGLLSRMPSSA